MWKMIGGDAAFKVATGLLGRQVYYMLPGFTDKVNEV